ncbi:peptidase M50 [Plantactinospora sp. CA-294935]|uniref:peptidase M50 n=1 Tax=Plantactinospora sp. CA-294935 TaxID=3240012 RepID=UPI003D8F7B2B
MTDSVMSGGATRLAHRPQVRSDLLFSRELGRGPDRVYLVKVRGGKAFEVAAKEHFLLSRLDGQRSLAEIGEEYAARFGRRLGPAQWSQLLWLLHQRDLLRPPGVPGAAEADAGVPAGSTVAPPRVLGRLAAAFAWVFSVPSGVVIGLGLLAMYGSLAAAAPALWQAAGPAFSDWRYVAGIAAISYLSAMLHELAHGVAAAHFGCRVIRLNLLGFSCQVEDYQYLPARAQQVTIAAAGGVSNSLFIVPFALAWQATPADSAGHRFAAAVVVVGAVQSLVNFVPVAPLDGYKMLSHQVGMVALAEESRRYLWSRPRYWLTRRGPRYPRRARVVLGLYGMAWHAMIAGAGAAIAYGAGHLLRPYLGHAGYAASTAAVVLTITVWLASRPRRPVRAAPTQQTPHHQRIQ